MNNKSQAVKRNKEVIRQENIKTFVLFYTENKYGECEMKKYSTIGKVSRSTLNFKQVMATRFAIITVAAFCIAASGTTLAQLVPNKPLKVNGVDDLGVAESYYKTIDPNDEKTNLEDWREANGFNDPINTVVEAKGFYSNGDVGFWRLIQMVIDERPGFEGNVAFHTVNYNTEIDSLTDQNAVSIINMEYSPGPMSVASSNIRSGRDAIGTRDEDRDEDHEDRHKRNKRDRDEDRNEDRTNNSSADGRITQFYVFDTGPTGIRLPSTSYDFRNEQLFLPAACFACHGGDDNAKSPMPPEGYAGGTGETGATFLSYDLRIMAFADDNPPPRGTADTPPDNRMTLADVEAAFKKFNEGVLLTNPTEETIALINGIYGGEGLPNDTQNLDYIPADWMAEAALYRGVVLPSCENCHTAAETEVLRLDWWMKEAGEIREAVFEDKEMPNSVTGYTRFLESTNPDQPAMLLEALNRFRNR